MYLITQEARDTKKTGCRVIRSGKSVKSHLTINRNEEQQVGGWAHAGDLWARR